MSLYLTIFDGDEEVTGWVFGHYSDFEYFRDVITTRLRAEDYPVLMTHSDCDGEWTVTQLPQLRRELELIGERFRQLPAEEPQGAFEHTAEFRRGVHSLYDCFHNIDGECVFEALIALCDEGIRCDRPILFQ
jgi:immunity protein 70 of polymorphic toxin system